MLLGGGVTQACCRFAEMKTSPEWGKEQLEPEGCRKGVTRVRKPDF